MRNLSSVQLTLLRHVRISAAEANAILSKNMNEQQVYCDIQPEQVGPGYLCDVQLHQLQYQILVLRLLQSKRMPDQNVIST